MVEFELDVPSLTSNGIQMNGAFHNVQELVCSSNDWLIRCYRDADSLEYYITNHSLHITPSEHLLSLHPSVLWISEADQMIEISSSIESIVILGRVGGDSFNLFGLPSLITLEMEYEAFCSCHSIVFESMKDWMNDEWDLIRLQSITLGYKALCGNTKTIRSNELTMKSMNECELTDQIFLLYL